MDNRLGLFLLIIVSYVLFIKYGGNLRKFRFVFLGF